MQEEVQAYIAAYPEDIRALFMAVRAMVLGSVPGEVTEGMWARLPSYQAGARFVRIIPFKDHINLEAKAFAAYREQLTGYRFTPKGMMQVRPGEALPEKVLRDVFRDTLAG